MKCVNTAARETSDWLCQRGAVRSLGPAFLPDNLPMGYQHGERPNWNIPFRKLARDVGLSPDLKAGYVDAATMLDPILAGRAKGAVGP